MTLTLTDVERIQRTFVQALADDTFERHGNRRGTWDISRGCEKPVPVQLFSRQTGRVKNLRPSITKGSRIKVKEIPMIELNLLTPCRRCPTCLAKHSVLWRSRAIAEIEQADRTWFGTLTLSPEKHFWVDTVCSSRKRDFASLPREQQFAEQTKVIGAEVTKYLKRLRKQSGHRFRYLVVTEIHDGEQTSETMRGRAHLHMLLHEFPGQALRKALLDEQWSHGFTQWRLADGNGAAWYIAKYISKASDARVRASLGYGNPLQSLNE